MIKTVLPASLIMFVFRVINHFSVAISQAVMVLAYVIITIRPLVRSATVHTILFNQTFVSVKTEIVQVRYTLNNVIAIIELMVKCQCDYNHLAVCKILSFLHLKETGTQIEIIFDTCLWSLVIKVKNLTVYTKNHDLEPTILKALLSTFFPTTNKIHARETKGTYSSLNTYVVKKMWKKDGSAVCTLSSRVQFFVCHVT